MEASDKPPEDAARKAADLRLEVAGGARAVAAARRTVAGLEPYIHADSSEAVLLLVSELVTNAIRHGGADDARPLGLEMSVSGQTIRVEVRDPGEGFSLESARKPQSEGGWGLVLVEKLADRWGIEHQPHVVWFEIDRPDTAHESSEPAGR